MSTISDIDTQKPSWPDTLRSRTNAQRAVTGPRASMLLLACDCELSIDDTQERGRAGDTHRRLLPLGCTTAARLRHLAARHPAAWGCRFTLTVDGGAVLHVADPHGLPVWSVRLDAREYRAIVELIDGYPWRTRRAGGEALLHALVERVTG